MKHFSFSKSIHKAANSDNWGIRLFLPFQGQKENAESTNEGPDVVDVVNVESVDNDVDVVHQGAANGQSDRIRKREIVKKKLAGGFLGKKSFNWASR